MDSEIEKTEMRLKSFLDQLQVERGILDRMVYKNKNQHRRCSYFQYLLKVRSDLRLLQSACLEEILSSSFLVINGKRAKQKVQLLESLKRRKCDGKHNFLERLLGAARLLSQIVEPMLKAAMEISKVLARSFFMGFSLTIMALLARLRVLVQQILLDVVTVFNVASSLSRKEQSVKLSQDGLEVFRDLYPTNEQQAVYLECVWEADKFVLIERINEPENKDQVMDVGEDLSLEASAIQYQSIETLLGEDEPVKLDPNFTSEQGPSNIKEDDPSSLEGKIDGSKLVEDGIKVEDFSGVAGTFSKNDVVTHSSPRMKWSFLSRTPRVAMPTNEDPIFSLRSGGYLKENLKFDQLASNLYDHVCPILFPCRFSRQEKQSKF